MTDPLKTDRALVFDFGRVVFRWRPDVLVATTLPHRATGADAIRHWVDQVFLSYGGDWGEFVQHLSIDDAGVAGHKNRVEHHHEVVASLDRVPEAVDAFRELIILEPDSAVNAIGLARLLVKTRDLNAAIQAFKAAVTIDSRDQGIRIELAHVLREADRLDESGWQDYELLLRSEREQGRNNWPKRKSRDL